MQLTAENLVVGWNGRRVAAVGELALRIGQVMVLAGPNGVGKSTIIKTLARSLPPIEGMVRLDGSDIAMMSARAFAARVAYVPQMLAPPAGMCVRDLVALGRNPHQMWWSWEISANDRKAIDEAMAATDIVELAAKPVGALSGGERQRVAIATALAQQAQFLLLDEPTAFLDFKHQLQLVSLLLKLRQNGLGIIAVLHDLNLIARLADQVTLLKHTNAGGVVAASGTVDAVLVPPILAEVYEVPVAVLTDADTGTRSYVPVV